MELDLSKNYTIKEENKLEGKEIRKLLFGKSTIFGAFGSKNVRHFDEKGNFKLLINDKLIDEGKAWIENGTLCHQNNKLFEGMKWCMDIYRNPDGNSKDLNDFFAIADWAQWKFSMLEQ